MRKPYMRSPIEPEADEIYCSAIGGYPQRNSRWGAVYPYSLNIQVNNPQCVPQKNYR